MGWLTRAVGWGVVIYAVMYLVWSGLVIYGLSLGLLSLALRILTLVLITTIAARSLRRADWKDILPFSISWAIVAVILDAIVPLLTSFISPRRGVPSNPRLS